MSTTRFLGGAPHGLSSAVTPLKIQRGGYTTITNAGCAMPAGFGRQNPGVMGRSFTSASGCDVFGEMGLNGLPGSDVFGEMGLDGLPVSVNWMNLPAVTEPKDQGKFGGCWAHSTAAVMEAFNAINTDHLGNLSVQQLVDCLNVSCSGKSGNPCSAFQYIIDNGGLVSAASYPFVGPQQIPPLRIEAPGVTIDSHVYLKDVDEFTLKALVAEHPVVVMVGADKRFDDYTHGVLDGPNYTVEEMAAMRFGDLPEDVGIGHYVALVGYGDLFGDPFWLIKNSWGLWGLNGFTLIARDTGKTGGAFGITRVVCYPLKCSANSPRCIVRSELEIYGPSSDSE